VSPCTASNSELADCAFIPILTIHVIPQPILETMVNKANDIYNRWADGQEVQTVLQHVVDEPDASACPVTASGRSGAASFVAPAQLENQHQGTHDPFAYTHHSLAQCIAEVHQRAKALHPQRKPCNCSVKVDPPCPPSHFWAPPPNIPHTSPVLPDLYSVVFQRGVLPPNGPTPSSSQPHSPLSPTSKLAVVDTINFELGALNSSTDQSWLSFF
jgi:hypothetical protein